MYTEQVTHCGGELFLKISAHQILWFGIDSVYIRRKKKKNHKKNLKYVQKVKKKISLV